MDHVKAMGQLSILAAGLGIDTAYASGTDSDAEAGDGSFDGTSANGTDSQAFSGEGSFDNAFASGNDSEASVGGAGSNLSYFDYGTAIGTDTEAESGAFGGIIPGAGTFSSGDIATAIDPSGTEGSTAWAGNGVADLATVYGDGNDAYAGFPGNFDFAGAFGDNVGIADAIDGNFLFTVLPTP